MATVIKIAFQALLVVLILGCTETEPPTLTQEEMLVGTWIEPFEWDSGIPDIVIPAKLGSYGSSTVAETTRVTFGNGQYHVEVFPPIVEAIGVQGDTLVNIYSPDTLFFGDYTITEDIIYCYDDSSTLRTRLLFAINNDSLFLADRGISQDHEFFNLVVYSFVWANSWSKNSGIFTRVE